MHFKQEGVSTTRLRHAGIIDKIMPRYKSIMAKVCTPNADAFISTESVAICRQIKASRTAL